MSGSGQVRKKLRPRLNGKSDHISKLPESVICHVLSRLPSKDAVRTSVLSKGWEYKWRCIYNINISDGERYPIGPGHRKLNDTNFKKFVDRILSPKLDLKKFRLVCWEAYRFDRLGSWITKALVRNTESLQLILPRSEDFVLPRSLCNNTCLRELKLVMCTFKVPPDSYYANLTYLHLGAVKIKNEFNTDDLIVFTFPVLETCLLMRVMWFVKRVEIHSPALTTLKCEGSLRSSGLPEYSINIYGARLVEFESSGELPECIILNDSKVLNADFKNYSRDQDLASTTGLRVVKLLEGFSGLTSMQLSIFTCKAIPVSYGPPIPKLDKLQRLAMVVWHNPKLLLELLRLAPSLKILEIQVDEIYGLDIPDVVVPHCVVSQLKEVKFNESYEKPPFRLAEYLLANALELRKVHLVGKDCPMKGKYFKQLSTFPRASSCLEITISI